MRYNPEQMARLQDGKCPKCGSPAEWHDETGMRSLVLIDGTARRCRMPLSEIKRAIKYPRTSRKKKS